MRRGRWRQWGRVAAAVALTAAALAADEPPGPARCTGSVPYAAGTGGYAVYRIPAVVRTPVGTLLAFAEGRVHGAGDAGAVDLVLRRSGDGGCTWGPLIVVAAGHGDTRGNPAPVVDPASGDVVLLSSGNAGTSTERAVLQGRVDPARGRRVYVQRSADDGRVFSAPEDITASVRRPDWRWYATGPGHALALTHGRYAGRLVVPADHSAAPPPGSTDTGREPRHYGAHALLSDDGGHSWRIGSVDESYDGRVNSNETTAAELPDGSLYFSTRDQLGDAPGQRADSRSADGGASLEHPYAPQPALAVVPVVQGSLLYVPGPGPGRPGLLLFSAPSVPDRRAAEALWTSADGGRTFTRALTLSPRPAAYSDLVRVDAETVGVLYETGVRGPYESIAFRRVPLARLGR
ncbi:glycoside hydrolase [Streptomyces sp. SKN60]|uniref:sialidase family protein n=1 Tax=Streptomyces sp. SKN60 TaxID=2855506 RepID=UPI0022457C3F|nr:sialidase family protein [Streptomyces sp. SKN60]MCX2183836.1 glycoside hydrolase [Streptomyces sp. SKN60]